MPFSQNFYNAVGSELVSLGFERALPFEQPNYAAYFRCANEQIGEYILVKDARAKGTGLSCDYCFAALDLPDDRILASNLGLRISVYNDWPLDDEIVCGIAKRVRRIAGLRKSWIAVAERELNAPAFESTRGRMILETARNVEGVKKTQEGRAVWVRLLDLVTKRKLSVFRNAPHWNEVLDRSIRARCHELVAIALDLDEKANAESGDLIEQMFYERALLLTSLQRRPCTNRDTHTSLRHRPRNCAENDQG